MENKEIEKKEYVIIIKQISGRSWYLGKGDLEEWSEYFECAEIFESLEDTKNTLQEIKKLIRKNDENSNSAWFQAEAFIEDVEGYRVY